MWWDKTSLEPGVPWDIAAFKGMLKSKIFIPLVSRGALQVRPLTRLEMLL